VGDQRAGRDILVANSGDGGKTWSEKRVAQGSGVFTSVGDVLDKEYVTAWGDGNAIVVWGDFRQGQKGSFISVKINASVTHDAGATWSAPTVISASFTESFVPVPTVAADGRVYVAFLNTTDNTTGRDDYEVVEVSPATGALVAGPFKVATTIDGFTTTRSPSVGRPTRTASSGRGGRQHHGRSNQRGPSGRRLV